MIVGFKTIYPSHSLDYSQFRHLNDLCFPNEPVSKREFQAFLGADFWSVFDQDALIAYSVMTTKGQSAHIRRIAVHPDYRGQGLGTDLMEAMLKQAKSQGTTNVSLLVQQDNGPAIHLYDKFGFVVTGESIQFSIPILPMDIGDFSVLPVSDYLDLDEDIPEQYQILDWAHQHNPPHKWVLVFLKKYVPIGFTCFSPEFPGCSPFELFTGNEVGDIQILVSLLDAYAFPHKRTIKITTGNATVIALFKTSGARVNYALYAMSKKL